MKKNNLFWLSIAAAVVAISGSAFATETLPASAGTSTTAVETAKHHGVRHHKGMHHYEMKAKDAVKNTEKKTA